MAVTFTERGTYSEAGSGATRTITLASGLAQGSIIAVACRATLTGGITLSSVASTKATFGSPVELATGANEVAVTIGVVTEAMTESDTITLTFANDGGYYTAHGAAYEITDVTTTANTTATAGADYTDTPSCSGTATANVAVFGLMCTTVTYTVGSGWTSSAAHTSGAYNNYYLSRTSGAAALDPGGSLSASTGNWWCVWVALELASAAAFARPSSDVADGNWLNEADSGTNLYASIDETTASDADYIKSGTSPANDTCTVGLGAISTPVSGTTTMRIRAKFL